MHYTQKLNQVQIFMKLLFKQIQIILFVRNSSLRCILLFTIHISIFKIFRYHERHELAIHHAVLQYVSIIIVIPIS